MELPAYLKYILYVLLMTKYYNYKIQRVSEFTRIRYMEMPFTSLNKSFARIRIEYYVTRNRW